MTQHPLIFRAPMVTPGGQEFGEILLMDTAALAGKQQNRSHQSENSHGLLP
jgi:hypothetical protein